MKHFKILCIFALTLSIVSCGTYVAKPGDITLEAAMASVGKSLVEMRRAQGNLRSGLIVSDAQVTFNISAKGSQGGKLYVEASPIPTTPAIQGKVGGEASTSYEASRGNQITVNFKNIVLSDPTKTLVKDANSITQLAQILRQEAIIDARSDIGGPVYMVAAPEPKRRPLLPWTRKPKPEPLPPAISNPVSGENILIPPGFIFTKIE